MDGPQCPLSGVKQIFEEVRRRPLLTKADAFKKSLSPSQHGDYLVVDQSTE